MSPKARVLVVANRTADSSELIAALLRRSAQSPASFTLLVPAVPRGISWATDMKAGGPEAEVRTATGARRMRRCGLEVTRATVGDPDPFAAVGDALRACEFDELVVATLPPGISRWLRISLPQRLHRMTDLPVTQVTVHPPPIRARRARSPVAAGSAA